MQNSVSILNLSNPKPRSSYISSRLVGHLVPIRSQTPQIEPLWHASENNRNTLFKVTSNQRLDPGQTDKLSSQLISSSSKKRLILKNKHKFPSDFFQSTLDNEQESIHKRQKSLVEPIVIPKTLHHCQSDPQLFNDESPNIHETPKFISDTIHQSDDTQLLQNKLLNPENPMNYLHNNISNSDSIQKSEFARAHSAILPATRLLESVTGKILQEKESKKFTKNPKRFLEESSKIPMNEAFGEANKTPFIVPSNQFIQRYCMLERFSATPDIHDHKHIQTAPENKTRIPITKNRILEEQLMARRSIDLDRGNNQSFLPTIKSTIETLENLPSLKTKTDEINNSINQYTQPQEREVFGVGLNQMKLLEKGNSKEPFQENSPLINMLKMNQERYFENRTQSQEGTNHLNPIVMRSMKFISYDDLSLNKVNQERTTLSEIEERNLTSGKIIFGKVLDQKQETEKSKGSLYIHRRYSSMDSENAVMKNPQKNIQVMNKRQRDILSKYLGPSTNMVRHRVPKNYLNHFSVDLRKSIEDLKSDPKKESSNKLGKANDIENKRNFAQRFMSQKDLKAKIIPKSFIEEASAYDVEKLSREGSQSTLKVEDQCENQGESNDEGRLRGFTFGKKEQQTLKEYSKKFMKVLSNKSIKIKDQKESENSFVQSQNQSFKQSSKGTRGVLQKIEIIKNQKEERNSVLKLVKH